MVLREFRINFYHAVKNMGPGLRRKAVLEEQSRKLPHRRDG